jgi:hypothetical protein
LQSRKGDPPQQVAVGLVIEAPGGSPHFVADSRFGDGGHFRRAREPYGPPTGQLHG